METEEHAKQTTRGAVRKAKKVASVTFRKAKETVYEYEERAKDVVGLGDTKEKVFEKVTGHTAGESLGKTKDSVAHGIGSLAGFTYRYEASFIAEVVDTIDCELDLKQVSTSAHLSGIEACTQVSLLFHHKENVCAAISSFKSLQTHVMILERKKL
ncbi:hypothetical protein Tco_0979144 [Tanacetum coccineum]